MNRILKTVFAVSITASVVSSSTLQFGGYLQNRTTLTVAGDDQIISDVNQARLEGSWAYGDWGGVEAHVLVSARLAPLDPFETIRPGSVMDRAFQQLLAPLMSSRGEMAHDTVNSSFGSLQAILTDAELNRIMRYLPYSTFYPSDKTVLDRALVKAFFKPFDLFIGRQMVSWGTGYAFNPTDVWNRKSPLDPDAPRAGVNALRMEIPLGAVSGISLVGVPGRDFSHSSAGVRVKTNVAGYDLSVSAMRLMNADRVLLGLPRKLIAGADLAGQIGEVGVWAEIAVNNPLYGAMDYTDFDSVYVQADMGVDYTFENGLYAMIEYYYNGLGRKDPAEYGAQDLVHLLAGEMAGFGRQYLFGGLKYTINGKYELSLFALGNPVDRSVMLLPMAGYAPVSNISLELGAQIGVGNRSRSEYGGMYPNLMLNVTGYF